MSRRLTPGFTLVELLVVIAIIGVLVGMALPALNASREMGRRNLCRTNLAQLMLAMQTYENAFESLPPGVTNSTGPIRSEPAGEHIGWLSRLLPYLDEGNAYRLIDFSTGVYDPKNAAVRELSPGIFICPSRPVAIDSASNYAGCHHDIEGPIANDNHGVLFLNSRVRREDITDGVSHTIFAGEKVVLAGDLGWLSGTRATLRNTGTPLNAPEPTPTGVLSVGGFGSGHAGGAFIALGDASVTFVGEDIDATLWQQLGHRADGKLLNLNIVD